MICAVCDRSMSGFAAFIDMALGDGIEHVCDECRFDKGPGSDDRIAERDDRIRDRIRDECRVPLEIMGDVGNTNRATVAAAERTLRNAVCADDNGDAP